MRIVNIRSAGGVILRKFHDNLIQTVVCIRFNGTRWELPKGTPNHGESIQKTALREVTEETGLNVQVINYIYQVRYSFIAKVREEEVRSGLYRNGELVIFNKRVDFFLMHSTGGSINKHDTEFEQVEWVDWRLAIQKLKFDVHKKILTQAVKSYH